MLFRMRKQTKAIDARYRTLGKWFQQVTHTSRPWLGWSPPTGLHASSPLLPAVGVSKDEMRQSIKKQEQVMYNLQAA